MKKSFQFVPENKPYFPHTVKVVQFKVEKGFAKPEGGGEIDVDIEGGGEDENDDYGNWE